MYKRFYQSFILVMIVSLLFVNLSFTQEKVNKDEEKAFQLYNKALLEKSNYKKVTYLKKAHELHPANAKISFLLGKTLLKNDKDDEAEEIFNKASQDPNMKGRVYKYLSNYYNKNKKYEKANFYLKKLVKSDGGDNYLNNYRLGEINSKKLRNYREAITYYEKAYKQRRYKDNHDILLAIAENYYNLAEYEQAIKYLNRYPHANKNNQRAFKLLISSYEKSNQKAKLTQNLQQYLKIWPYDRWARKIAKKNGVRTSNNFN